MLRLCTKCGEEKPPDGFHKGSRWCKPCKIKLATEWNRANPERHREHCRGKHKRKQTLRRYGLTEADFDLLLERQGGACLICRDRESKLFVDHDHATGIVRGLLCVSCNTMLGFAKDSPDRLRDGALYLERSASVRTATELVTP